MTNLSIYLNKKNSLRNLTDEEFESIVSDLAFELEKINIVPEYSDSVLKQDWNNLIKWKTNEVYINSTSRIGMKLCEHFFPNFYNISNNRGHSFLSLWKQDNLVKVLRWNRKSHSTPYLSELKRGIYFCCGMTKSTMYRPQMMKMITDHYNAKIVLDPCMGWGGRMLGAVAAGAHYIGFDPNTETYKNLKTLAKFLEIEDKVTLICDDAMNMLNYDIPKVDLVLTSPPYFDLEVYTEEQTQSVNNHHNYRSWADFFLKGIIHKSCQLLNPHGVSCWNVGKVGKNDMAIDVRTFHSEINFEITQEFQVISSKRQALQTEDNKKSSDNTVAYKIKT